MQSIPAPEGAIQFERDELGYPSIEAGSLLAGTYALGYLHAVDRLTQVTFTNLAARGELMSVLGDVPVARLIDLSTRTLGLGAHLGEQVVQCDPESRALLQAYCDGFNAGARRRGKPWLLRLLGVEPFFATPENVFSVFRFVTYFGLTSMQMSTELILSELIARGAPRSTFERLLGDTARGLDLEALRGIELPDAYSYFRSGFGSPEAGSNAFAVAKERSATGGALLMGEFHMEVGRSPPLLYAAHLSLGADRYLSGITIPGLAWFVAGRTRNVSWSYTFAHADNVDFLVEHVKDGRYEARGEYRAFRTRQESVRIKKRPSETWTFYENDYGTLLGSAQGEGKRLCVRVSGLAQTHRAFSAARRVVDCRNVEELIDVQRELRSCSLEAIMADRDGRIASVVTGQLDERPAGWNGAYPRAGWDLAGRAPAVVAEDARPLAIDPPSGALTSANQGGQGPQRAVWCNYPEPLYRFQRITELLAARERHDLQSMLAISYDCVDGSARRLLPVWEPLLPEHPLARALVDWAEQQSDRKLVQLFLSLHEEVTFRLLELDLEPRIARRFREWSALAFFQPQLDSLLALEQPERLDRATLQRLLHEAFPVALAAHEQHEVPIVLRFKHLVTQGKTPAFLGFDSKPLTLPGTPVTPFQCRVSPVAGERLIYAPAFHLLCDMSQDHASYNLPGGASESRFGPGYGKGVEAWLTGTLLPLGPRGTKAPRLSRTL